MPGVHLFDVEDIFLKEVTMIIIIVSADNRSCFWSEEGLSTGGIGHIGNMGKKHTLYMSRKCSAWL